jgi:hypothetical protein
MKNNAKDLRKKIDDTIQELATLADTAAASETMENFLLSCAKFYKYSVNNLWLIWISCPHASHVAGYKAWNKHNRFVKKGEQGIPILAPCMYKTDPDDPDSDSQVKGFRIVYVFDVTQTDGEILPPPPEWRSHERLLLLENILIIFAQGKGISVDREKLDDGSMGKSKGNAIVLDEEAGTKVLIHEIAHELMHRGEDRKTFTRQEKELEAEAVSFVVSRFVGLETPDAPNYLALWDIDSAQVMARMGRIRTTAAEIIRAIDPPEEVIQ